jgi:hypothetical protein
MPAGPPPGRVAPRLKFRAQGARGARPARKLAETALLGLYADDKLATPMKGS